MIINFISCPRTVSTAMMYSFGNRPDTIVIDEPFYAYYLEQSGKNHPGRLEILNNQSRKFEIVIKEIKELSGKTQILFLKNMAHHILSDDFYWLKVYQNVLLIRHPKQLIYSFCKVFPDATIFDIGLKRQYEIYSYFQELGIECPILNSNDVISNPESQLKKLCKLLDIPFTGKMLTWPEGEKDFDGVWAKYWYGNVHQSTGFESKYREKNIQLSSSQQNLLNEALPYFEKLNQQKI